jgi:IstB-like ATP binding protein
VDAIVDVVCGDQRACSGGRADARPTAFRFVAADERRALGISSHWPFESWGRFLPEHTTAVSLLDRLLHHANVVVTDGDSYRMRQARARKGTTLNKT